jgi:hypothetical protein
MNPTAAEAGPAHDRPSLDACTTHAQLLCLSTYLKDDETAGQLRYAWSALTRACHHHPYELPPATAELEGWLGMIAACLRQAPSSSARMPLSWRCHCVGRATRGSSAMPCGREGG